MCLPYGDYGAWVGDSETELKPVPVMFERKSKSDLWGTMASNNYERFKREMARAKDANHKLILLIEGSYSDILEGLSYSQFSGSSMIKKLATLHVKYDLDYWFCFSRREMASRIADTYFAIERHWGKVKQNEEGK